MSPAHLLHVFFARVLPLLLLALLGARAMAQADPPSRVGRVNLAEGAVAFSQAGDNEWTDAIRNRPLTRGDRVWTERNARAEIQVGSSAVRLAPSTHLEILQLDDRAAQLSVTQGSVYVRIRTLPEGENFEIDTPNLAYRAAYPGDYRIDVDPMRGVTRVTIHSGTGAVYGEAGQVLPLGGGQQITFRDRTLAQVSVQESPPQDNFDRWAADRNRREEQSVSARYVPREVVGYQELDSAGRWSQDATHGAVWFPQGMPANWAPYRNGHWEWMSPWGWTWMDDAAWGFAPFHYGRWAVIDSRWAWVPGRLSLKPVYAPALVAFVGGGSGSQWNLPVIAGKPGVAWFPLAPGEVWQPSYRASPVYMSNLNQNFKLEANPTYANQRKPEALTSIPAEEFHRGKPAGAGWLRIAANSLTNAQIVPPPPMPERGGTIAMSRVAPAKVTVPQPDTTPAVAPRRVAAPATQVAALPASQTKAASETKPATQAAVQAAALAQAAAQAARVQAAAQQQAEVQRVLQAAQQQRAEAERARQQQAKVAAPAVAAAKAPAAPPVVAATVPAVVPSLPAPVQPQVAPAKRADVAKTELAQAEVVKSEIAKAELAKAERAKAERAKAEKAKAEVAKAEHAKAARARALEQARIEQARVEQAKAEQDRAEEQARREVQARRAEQGKREQVARRAEAKREQIAEARREQIAAAKREQIAAAKQAKLAEAQAKRELVAKREREQAAKRELLAKQAEQAKRELLAKRAELQREQMAKRAEQATRELLAKQAEQAKREAVARRDEQQRRELHAQHVEQARRAAERDAQALREQRIQREEQQAKREAQDRQERELAQQQAQRAAIARQQQALAEQWRRDQQAWEQQQQQLRLRGRPDLRDDRRSRGIPILNSGPMS